MFFLFLFSDNLRSTGVDFSFESLLEFFSKSIWAWGSFYLNNLNESFSFASGISLFKLFLWSWFNFGKWCPSRELSISLIFSNFVEYNFLKFFLMILWISSVKLISLIHCIFFPWVWLFLDIYSIFLWFLYFVQVFRYTINLLVWDLSSFFFNVGILCY